MLLQSRFSMVPMLFLYLIESAARREFVGYLRNKITSGSVSSSALTAVLHVFHPPVFDETAF